MFFSEHLQIFSLRFWQLCDARTKNAPFNSRNCWLQGAYETLVCCARFGWEIFKGAIQSTVHGRRQKCFQVGGNVEILLDLFRLLTMQCKSTFTKRFTLSTSDRMCPMFIGVREGILLEGR